MAASTTALTGAQKAAVLLVQLGREKSAAVLKSLRETEVEEVLAEIARMQGVPTETVDAVFDEFQNLASARRYYAQGGVDFAREVLEATVGPEKAAELLSRMKASLVEMPFEFLRRADARQVLSFLQEEHPQTVALVLAHMRADQAAIVLSGMPDDLQADVAHRVAVMETTSPDVVRQVDSKELATALKGVKQDVRDKIMDNVSERAASNLADEIEMLGAVRLSSVEEAQAKVIAAIRALEESGQIIISRGDRDEYVV